MSLRTFLVSGLIAGLVAGVVAFAVAYTVGEPAVRDAIAIEEAGSSAAADDGHTHDHASDGSAAEEPHSHGDEEGGITRTTQETTGLLTGLLVLGTAFGGLLGIVAAYAVGRLGALRPLAGTALVGLLAFVAVALVPWLLFPPNPPAVGSGDTIDERTAQYFSVLLVSVVAAFAAVSFARALHRAGRGYLGVTIAGVGYLVVVLGMALVLPRESEVPADFSADVLYGFRISSLLTQAALWATATLVLTALIARRQSAAGSSPVEPHPSSVETSTAR
ncbi:UNVERIFIED_CONTAM: hypothetical protein LK11_02755 [Mumia flava]